jgi:hypothetical protein
MRGKVEVPSPPRVKALVSKRKLKVTECFLVQAAL